MKNEKLIQKKMKSILDREFSVKKFNYLIIFLSVAILITTGIIYNQFASGNFIIPGIILLIEITILFVTLRSKRKTVKAQNKLDEVYHNFRTNNIKAALEILISVYETHHNSRLLEFIFLFSTHYRPDFTQQSQIVNLEYSQLKSSKKYDKKLIGILNQIMDEYENIDNVNLIIAKANKRIEDLKEDFDFDDKDNEFAVEFAKITNRYQEIISNSQKKKEDARSKIEQLLKLKKNFAINQKLLKAKEELKKLEDELWEDSFSYEYPNVATSNTPTRNNSNMKVFLPEKQNLQNIENIQTT